MTDQEIVESLINLWGHEHVSPLTNVIWYGSRASDADIDLLLLCSREAYWRTASLGRLDLVCIAFEEFKSRVMLFDPRVTEPLLNGEIIFGDTTAIIELQEQLKVLTPNESVQTYLFQLALEQYLSSKSFLNNFLQTNHTGHLLWALINLGFAYSSRLLAKSYASYSNKGPLTIKELLQENHHNDFNQLWSMIRWAKRNPTKLEAKQVVDFQNRWRELSLLGK